MAAATVQVQTRRLFESIGRAAGIETEAIDRPGLTISGEPDRAGTRLVSAYQLGPHLLVRCDPEVVESCRSLITGPTDLTWFERALPDSAERLGRGWIHLIEPGRARVDDRVDRLDRVDDLDLIRALVTDDPQGADDAEIDLDDLDELIFGVVLDGVLAAYASERPWDTDPDFADIGVATHPEHRRKGLGAAVVAAVTARVAETGRFPMYRCNATNAPSRALADRVGYTSVASLTAAIL